MQGFTPQNRKKESVQGNASKPVPQITPKKVPSAQAQAMNQQPDSVPAMVKPGEYVLPADTVDAVGGPQALDGVVQATHTQAPDTAVVPQGFEPQYFFSQGGGVPDEEKRAVAPAAPAVSTATASEPVAKPVAPTASSNPAPAVPAQQAYENWQAAKTPWYSQATPTSLAKEKEAEQAYTNALRNPQSPVKFGGQPGAGLATPATAPSKPAPASAPAQQTPAADTPVTTAAAPVKPAATAAPVQSSTTAANPAQLPSGVYQHGRGQYSDSADGMGFTPGFTGRPNAQNLEAASNLSAQGQRESMGRVASAMTQPQAVGFRAPTVAHSGNDFAARKRLENMATAASSIMNTERWGGRGASRNPAVQAYEGAVKADLQAQGLQPEVDTKVMGFNAGLMREQMSQDGANQRAAMQEAGADRRDTRRAGLDARRLGMEETAQGFQTRQGQRLEQAQTAYLNAKTPEEKASALATMRALSGKGEGSLKDNYMSLGGGQEWDAKAGTMRNVPQRLIDLRTGQEVGASAAKPNTDFQVGKVYTDANGNKARYTAEGWKPL